MKKIPKFEKDYMPMFRDSDAQGLIGLRAYLYYFQDMATEHLHLMENVFSPDFYSRHSVKEMELHYTAQSFYGDEIKIYKKETGNCCQIAGRKEDGTNVFLGIMTF